MTTDDLDMYDMAYELGMTIIAKYLLCPSLEEQILASGYILEDRNGKVLFEGSEEEVWRHLERLTKLKAFI